MKNKKRLEEIEYRVRPDQKIIVIYEDPNIPGLFYDRQSNKPDRVLLTKEAIKALGAEPGAVILWVQYDRSGKSL